MTTNKPGWMRKQQIQDLLAFGKVLALWVACVVFLCLLVWVGIGGDEVLRGLWIVLQNKF